MGKNVFCFGNTGCRFYKVAFLYKFSFQQHEEVKVVINKEHFFQLRTFRRHKALLSGFHNRISNGSHGWMMHSKGVGVFQDGGSFTRRKEKKLIDIGFGFLRTIGQ